MEEIELSELVFDDRNANIGTESGMKLLEESIQTLGAGRSVLVDRNGRLIAGNKTVETAGQLGMKGRVIKTDGKEIIVHMRTDIDIDSPEGRKLAILDNRVAEENLKWDIEVLKGIEEDFDINLGEFGMDKMMEEIERRSKSIEKAIQLVPGSDYVIILCRDDIEGSALRRKLGISDTVSSESGPGPKRIMLASEVVK